MTDTANETLTKDSLVDIACFEGKDGKYFYKVNTERERKTVKDWQRIGSFSESKFRCGCVISTDLRNRIRTLISTSGGNIEAILDLIFHGLLAETFNKFQYLA